MADDNTAHKADTKVIEASADDVRRSLGDFLSRAGFGNERIVIVRHGKQIAALVGMKDVERLIGLESTADAAA